MLVIRSGSNFIIYSIAVMKRGTLARKKGTTVAVSFLSLLFSFPVTKRYVLVSSKQNERVLFVVNDPLTVPCHPRNGHLEIPTVKRLSGF